MTIITEENSNRNRHSTYYLTTLDSAGLPIDRKRFDGRILEVREGEIIKIAILDDDGKVRTDPDRYLNDIRKYVHYTTRRQMATALNFYHLFCDMQSYDYKHITASALSEFILFLRGLTVKPEPGSRVTYRSAKTVNMYYGFVKLYVKTMKWDTAAFSVTVSTRVEAPIGDIVVTLRRDKDVHTLPANPLEGKQPPMHLTPKQADALLNYLKDTGNMTDYLLARLQTGSGFRGGELLGLTTEDIITKICDYGETRNFIVLRNRCSDARGQSCKGLYHPTTRSEYGTQAYKSMAAPEVEISKELYNAINAYYDITRDEHLPAAKRKKIERETLADSVVLNDAGVPTKKNHYIFVGKNGRRYTMKTYNNHLKKAFLALGIPVDKGVKHTNCSHRLRHTFAMGLTTYTEIPATRLEVRDLLRHSSVASGEAYFTPTTEEAMESRRKFEKALAELIPGLRDSGINEMIKRMSHNKKKIKNNG